MVTVMLRIALAIVVIFAVKKPSLVGSNSVCYSFHYEEATDINESYISSSLWQYKQDYGLNLRSENALKLLLILAGDIELCPGPAVKCCGCSKTIRKNQLQCSCDSCKLIFHIKCLIDKLDDDGHEQFHCLPCSNLLEQNLRQSEEEDEHEQSQMEPLFNDLIEQLSTRGLKIFHQNVNHWLSFENRLGEDLTTRNQEEYPHLGNYRITS